VTACGHRFGLPRLSVWLAVLAAVCGAGAAEVIPPAPAAYFNDYAGIVSGATAQKLNAALDQFERETSNQVVVAIYPTMQSDSSVEDYTVRVKQAWQVGLKGKDNGVVLFVFVDSHQVYIQVGYGLEPVLTDALCKRIISDEIAPRFRSGDYDGGMTAAVNSIMAATKGEYHGTGRTVGDQRAEVGRLAPFGLMLGLFILINYLSYRQRGSVYGRSGHGFVSGMLMGMLLNNGRYGGGGFGGGGGGGFGGGGFSGGGGGGGGGGAGGSW
jgi:uncharacterized protein